MTKKKPVKKAAVKIKKNPFEMARLELVKIVQSLSEGELFNLIRGDDAWDDHMIVTQKTFSEIGDYHSQQMKNVSSELIQAIAQVFKQRGISDSIEIDAYLDDVQANVINAINKKK